MKSSTSFCGGLSIFDTFGVKEVFNCGNTSSLSDVHIDNNNNNDDRLYQHHHHHLHALLAGDYNNNKNYSVHNDNTNMTSTTSPNTYSKDIHNELRKRQRLERRAEQQHYQHQPSLRRNNSTGRSTFSASSSQI